MKNTLLTLLLFFSLYAKGDDFKAHFINVSQADATLLEFSKGVVMIDVGGELKNITPSRTSLNNYLSTFYERRADLKKTIDLLIITHNHYDHISLITDLSKNYTIKRIITSKFKLTKEVEKAAKNERVYELRSYESATEKIFQNKVHMFNEGDEIGLFKRLNFNAIFYAEVVAGSKMPNLMYMTSFENMADRDAHWKSFGSDPVWKKLSAMSEYKNNVSHIDIMFLRPTDYSDY